MNFARSEKLINLAREKLINLAPEKYKYGKSF